MTPQTLAEYASEYAAAGWPVFPLVPRTKRPATAHGKDDASTDTDQIRSWWAATPTANIGLRPVPGVIVLDVDPRNGGTLDALGHLPATWIARTGGGGWHLLYRYQGEVAGRVRDADGIDIKANSGYIVAAPSIHPDGGIYRWETHGPVVALPQHLHSRVRRHVPRPRGRGTSTPTPGGIITVVAEAQPGNRNNVLFWAACRLAEENAPHTAWDDLRASAQLAGLGDMEIAQTIASALGKGVGA